MKRARFSSPIFLYSTLLVEEKPFSKEPGVILVK